MIRKEKEGERGERWSTVLPTENVARGGKLKVLKM